MDIKFSIKKPSTTVLQAEIPTSSGVGADAVPRVVLHINQIDAYGILDNVGRVSCSPDEARALAARLVKEADSSEETARVLAHRRTNKGDSGEVCDTPAEHGYACHCRDQ